MSWYVGEDGEQIWINRDSTVYTVVVSDAPLPVEHLTYLAVSSKKAVYQEAMCEDEGAAGGRSKRNKDKNAGRQRGFIIRQEIEESPLTRVVPWFKDAAKKLMDTGVVSRVDADEAANVKKAKKKERASSDAPVANLGANECRIETTSKIHHFAHGPGYRVQVAEGMVAQRLNLFTNRKEIAIKDWHSGLLSALESTGTHIMLLKRASGNGQVTAGAVAGEKKEDGDGEKKEAAAEMKIQLRRDKAQQAENDWLQSLLGGGEAEPQQVEAPAKQEEAAPAAALRAPRPANPPAERSVQEAPRTEAAPSRRRDGKQHDEAEAPPQRRGAPKNAWAPAMAPATYTNGWQDSSWQKGNSGWNEWDEWSWWREEQAPAAEPVRRWNKQARTCDECQRGGNLKLYQDGDGKYCRICWVQYYLAEPPASAALR